MIWVSAGALILALASLVRTEWRWRKAERQIDLLLKTEDAIISSLICRLEKSESKVQTAQTEVGKFHDRLTALEYRSIR